MRLEKTSHYHIDFDLNLGLSNDQILFLKQEVAPRDEITTLSFQITRDCKEAKMKDGCFMPAGKLLGIDEQLKNIETSLNQIISIMPTTKILAVENNNYYDTGAYDIATSSAFINKACRTFGIELLLDIAHAQVSSQNKNIPFNEYIEEMLDDVKCTQMHLCMPEERTRNGKQELYDAHLLPTKSFTAKSLSLAKSIGCKYLTIEYYRDGEKLVRYLEQLRDFE